MTPEKSLLSESVTGGLDVGDYFSRNGVFENVDWEKRETHIADEKGGILFTQKDVLFPSFVSQLATQIIVSRYFYGEIGKPERENSFQQLIERVSKKLAEWGFKDRYFDANNAKKFENEVSWLTLNQHMAFNSPTWFNVGVDRIAAGQKEKKDGWIILDGNITDLPIGGEYRYPQTSACFIQGVDDTMESIMQLAVNEAVLFKHGSGTGSDLSTLRSAREKLSGGGKPSGPLAYLQFYDRVAGIVKSGGKTRRAAKMDSLRVDHPDILEFIQAKMREERKIHLLMDEGGVDSMEASETVAYQNANLSIRATDAFMNAVIEDQDWQTTPVHCIDMKDKMPKYKARELMEKIAKGTYECGDPGMQFHDTINKWHTCPNSAPINASNPCSEYMFVNDSACNLASLNLMKFMDPTTDEFDIEKFEKAVRITAIAQDLEIDNSSYPTAKIAENAHKFRPLGMGYSNLGALLMYLGLPYDSDEGRGVAAVITALMTGKVYEASTEMAENIGVFDEYKKNQEPMMNVIRKHRDALNGIDTDKLPNGFIHVYDAAIKIWENVIKRGQKFGFRNAQATVLAPTGTIGFMMDCDTLGIEPDIGLVKTKLLAEGGTLKLVNQTMKHALKKLNYSQEDIKKISDFVLEKGCVEGCEIIKQEHLPIFDCAISCSDRVILPQGHLKMMATVQPFLSGAISKTVNLPNDVTEQEIFDLYVEAWKMGLKAVAMYRDGSKRRQPLTVGKKKETKKSIMNGPVRRKLPTERRAVIHKFNIGGHEGYLTIGLYNNGEVGEIFINMSKEGSTIGGLMGTIGVLASRAMQYGVPLRELVQQFKRQRFDPLGIVLEGHPEIKSALSIIDYIGNYLEKSFIDSTFYKDNLNIDHSYEPPENSGKEEKKDAKEERGGFCAVCGVRLIRKGSCKEVCPECGWTSPNGCGE